MPPHFLLPIKISFGQRISGARLVTVAIAACTANALARDSHKASTKAIRGRSSTLTYNPSPAGECQLWSLRPRPAVCSSATHTLPCAAPDCAASNANTLVDPTEGKCCRLCANAIPARAAETLDRSKE